MNCNTGGWVDRAAPRKIALGKGVVIDRVRVKKDRSRLEADEEQRRPWRAESIQ